MVEDKKLEFAMAHPYIRRANPAAVAVVPNVDRLIPTYVGLILRKPT